MADEFEALVVNSPNETVIVTDEQSADVITSGAQGPPGVADEDMTRAVRTDEVLDSPSQNKTTIYIGQAQVGVLDSEAAWRIKRVILDDTSPGTDTVTEWAENGGVATADEIFVWDDHLTYNYS
jgi:hypothetical protein